MTNSNHPIENLMGTTMENLRDMIDVNTVVGDAIETKDGSYIVPISRVSFGFASGGSEIPNKEREKLDDRFAFGGGSGAGVSVKPVAFLVLKGDSVRLLPVNQTNTYDRVFDSIPQIIEMFKDINYNKRDMKKDSCDCD
ncbi:sporulation protein YtfJ [Clostridium perfringens]|nr:sporulation protein YtfJ [Clostridium perfringens]